MALNLSKESLSQIFLEAKRRYSEYDRRWIWLAHICHDWREISLSCPDLWYKILLDGTRRIDVELLKVFLERAQGRLAEIQTIDQDIIPDSHQIQIIETILSSAEHIGSLIIDVLKMFDVYPFDRRMSNLKTLHLFRQWGMDLPEFLPTADQFPSLRSLELAGNMSPWRWPLPLFASLTKLNLDNCWHDYTMDELLDILDICSSLQDLRFDRSLPHASGSIVEDGQRRSSSHCVTSDVAFCPSV
ncbi:hypothetical protein OBBRIDRAFT_886743 [Obba rivulosa]|uniref:F-box domain-containing protein n=1 Tax=Obba rivulosa TaxID=1052685 RepID=A0A8E2DLN1_9APHY|nr:hypothetical protein OBBRIDRAFT_886743 [Obba rivulosa]